MDTNNKHANYYERLRQEQIDEGMSRIDADYYVINVRRDVQRVMQDSRLDESSAISIVANTSKKIFFRDESV